MPYNRRHLLRHIICALLAVSFVYFFFIYNKTSGSDIPVRQSELTKNRPHVVVIGDSMVRAGIDEQQLSKKLGVRVSKAFSNGSASAWWYLYIKNVLCEVSECPKVALIVFRDHFLTDPQFRIDGQYSKPIRTLSNGYESVLNEIWRQADAKGSISPHSQSVFQWLPAEVKEGLERRLYKSAGNLLRIPKGSQASMLEEMFSEEKMIEEMLSIHQLSSEQAVGGSDFDFDGKMPHSLLPQMLELLRKREITPIFVRMKRRRDLNKGAEPAALKDYIASLRHYLERNGAILIDFTYDASITKDHYGPGDHLNDKGKALLSNNLAEILLSIPKKLQN